MLRFLALLAITAGLTAIFGPAALLVVIGWLGLQAHKWIKARRAEYHANRAWYDAEFRRMGL